MPAPPSRASQPAYLAAAMLALLLMMKRGSGPPALPTPLLPLQLAMAVMLASARWRVTVRMAVRVQVAPAWPSSPSLPPPPPLDPNVGHRHHRRPRGRYERLLLPTPLLVQRSWSRQGGPGIPRAMALYALGHVRCR